MHHPYHSTLINCVFSSSIVGSRLNEASFVEQQGIFVLLDALETCPRECQNLTLVTLSDLCENETALKHVKHWRSKVTPDTDVVRLLLRIWKQQQQELKIPLAEDGILAGLTCTRYDAFSQDCIFPSIDPVDSFQIPCFH